MLTLKNIKKSYDGTVILKDVNLDIQEGEIVSILGSSGSGKTTLLNVILGITDCDCGQILLTEKILRKYLWKNEVSISSSRTMHCFQT